jgi:hypothetical protein
MHPCETTLPCPYPYPKPKPNKPRYLRTNPQSNPIQPQNRTQSRSLQILEFPFSFFNFSFLFTKCHVKSKPHASNLYLGLWIPPYGQAIGDVLFGLVYSVVCGLFECWYTV